ncbi:MAG: HAD family hydrolase [Deltaproteobacteria bacterium]|jgi:D-glycero-D-manno-heptose 1,7-bisphosphate phosphatase|nr:HAD family hydrolase [Deltaproteobacteria bacterium]
MQTDNRPRRRGTHATYPGEAPRDILLDRDGTLIEDRHYLSDPAQVTLLPGVAQALRRLSLAACRLFVVSNQSGVGRGYFSLENALACNARLAQLLAAHGVHFTDMLLCPHSPEDGCGCRKPQTGMWDMLRARHGLHAARTAMIGDKRDDVRFGRAAGLRTILVLTGKGRDHAAALGLPLPDTGVWTPDAPPPPEQPHAVAADLAAAVDFLGQP